MVEWRKGTGGGLGGRTFVLVEAEGACGWIVEIIGVAKGKTLQGIEDEE